jgi:hypothetical protein
MRRFIIQVIANAFALTLVLMLLPQVDIHNGNLLTIFLPACCSVWSITLSSPLLSSWWGNF